MKVLWKEFGGLFLIFAIGLCIVFIIALIAFIYQPDYYIYEFHTPEGLVTFEVDGLIDEDSSSYTFRLIDGRKVIYRPVYGTTVYITEVRN